jgi:VWFA-related protein
MRFEEGSLHLRCSCLLTLGLVSCCVAPLCAQTAPDAQAGVSVLKANALAVAVDVVVTRGNDEPVLSLRKQDFQVLEDGKPQPIDLFEEHTAATSTPTVTPQQLPPHVYTNLPAAPQSDSVNVLLLDSLNTEKPDQAYVRKQIVDFLRNIQPGTRVAIFTLSTRLRLVQGFTADSLLLKAALNSDAVAPGVTAASRTRDDDLRDKEELSIIGEMSNTKGAESEAPLAAISRSMADRADVQGGQRASLTLAALDQLARSLAAIPGRKNLIWFASSFPISIFPNGSNRQTLSNGREIGDAVRQTAHLLTQSKVALYPVSAQGILLDRTTNADSGGQPEGDDFEKAPQPEGAANAANAAAMEQLAADTGGEALYTSNNLSQAMARAIENGSHYYTLVYTPPSTEMDGKFHRIEVKLTEGKAKLSYRRGYYADKASGAKPASDPLPPLLARGMPNSTQILYQARVLPASPQPAPGAPRTGGNTKLAGTLARYKVDFVIPAGGVALDPAPNGMHTGTIEVALVAYDHDGAAVNWTGNTLAISLNAASYAQVQRSGLPAHLEIDLPNADVYLATGVYDWGSRKSGTLEIPLSSVAAATTYAPPMATETR